MAHIKEKINNTIKKVEDAAGNAVSKTAALSSKELEEISKKRKEFFADKNEPDSAQTDNLLAAVSVEIYEAYLSEIKNVYFPISVNTEYDFDPEMNVRYFEITKWVTDKNENSIEKLVNVYEAFAGEFCNIALIYNRTSKGCKVFFGIVNLKNETDQATINSFADRLKKTVSGNFPGSEISKALPKVSLIPDDSINKASVAAITNIPAEKSEKFISQTIEKLLDGIAPEEIDESEEYNSLNSINQDYTLFLIATPVHNIDERKLAIANFYSKLTPLASWSKNYTANETDTTGSAGNVHAGIGGTKGRGSAESVSDSKTETKTLSAGLNGMFSFLSTLIGCSAGGAIAKAITNTVTSSDSSSTGNNFGLDFARMSSKSVAIGKSEGLTQNYENYNIRHTLDILEKQMQRMDKASALGLWDFGAYVVSEDYNITNNVAHAYLALTQGDESYLSKSAINIWQGGLEKNEDGHSVFDDESVPVLQDESIAADEILAYLQQLRHPLFGLNPNKLNEDINYAIYPTVANSTTALTGAELGYALSFPKKSITGLPVFECAAFGRNINTYDSIETENNNKNADVRLPLGQIYHMHQEESTHVYLSKKSLAAHTFITGATGSGKSNTVYKMLTEAKEKGVNFLVIEPAKGEYKDVFGNEKDVSVYGTNPYKSPLLRINPFSFPKDIHILEHLDRLVEIFNVCWPMYAAMPAVLKDAVSQAYVNCGWNLTRSVNKYGCDIYPTFSDVAGCVKEIINSSEYDNDTKGAYKGALLARLHSLTNGINGLIFANDELSGEKLFDENVIVDISRVGSNETKSLIMGMLVLKLQEYRMSTRSVLNADLKHVTVLEEAHNLLKNTAGVAIGESGNLTGKSVEMIANAIAEMRTYGEGFIIADQAPGLLDKAAIRNTNTKIIMRLPDFEDRELVGNAANLNDDQITELAKLPCGVAAVYQNEWIQPVLCKVEKYEYDESGYVYEPKEDVFEAAENSEASSSLLDCIMKNEIFGYDDKEAIRQLRYTVVSSNLDSKVKVDFMDYIAADAQRNIPTLRKLLYDLLSAEKAIDAARSIKDVKAWAETVVKNLDPSINDYSKRQINDALRLLIFEQSVRNREYFDLYTRFTEIFNKKGGIL